MTRPRRDPRAERSALLVASAPRPRLDRKAQATHQPTRARRDPRTERDARRREAPSGRFRYELARSATGAATSPVPARLDTKLRNEPERVFLAGPDFWVLVVRDAPSGPPSAADRGLIGAARRLAGERGGVAVLGAGGTAHAFGDAGADRLLPCDPADLATPVRAMATIKRATDALRPRHVLFSDDPVAGGDLARRWAVRQRLPVTTGVVEVKETAATRRAEGGIAEHAMEPAAVLALRPEAGVAFAGPPHEATLLELDPGEPTPAATSAPVPLPLDPDAVPLGEAEFVLSAGNGISDFAAFDDVARSLGAVKAGSRVVCDAGHLPRDRQVGASGAVLRARCYLALGIAGAPQHLQGIPEVEHVIAINTDLHAAMVKRAGLAIVADAQAVMPALVRAAQARRKRPPC